MEVTNLPFNKLIGIAHSEESEYLLSLPNSNNYQNHLETVHASALFALAEASSGKFLLSEFKKIDFPIVPVVRKVMVKYNKPANGKILSKGKFVGKTNEEYLSELTDKSRTLIDVEVTLYTEDKVKVMSTEFQWFVSKI